MSALNICHKPDRVIFMQDAACYDPSGVILDFVEKGAEISEMGCFVACTGASAAVAFMKRLLPIHFRDIDDLGDNGESVLDHVYQSIADDLERWGSRGLTMAVAGWSQKLDRPRTVIFGRGGGSDYFGGDVGCLTHPQLEGAGRREWLAYHGMQMNIERFDPLTDGIRLMELQRSQLSPRRDGRPDAYLVGGFITLTEVARRGITQRVVHTWPEDLIGERIRPTPLLDPVAHSNVTPLAGMNRAERRRMGREQPRGAA